MNAAFAVSAEAIGVSMIPIAAASPDIVDDFLLFHHRAVLKSNGMLKPLAREDVLASSFIIQVENYRGITIGQCRLVKPDSTCGKFGYYPAQSDDLILASLSGIKYFPRMITAMETQKNTLGARHIVMKTNAANPHRPIMEACGFTGGSAAFVNGDAYPSVFYGKDLNRLPAPAYLTGGTAPYNPLSSKATYCPA